VRWDITTQITLTEKGREDNSEKSGQQFYNIIIIIIIMIMTINLQSAR
jgi:hypothetical protein